MLRSNQQCTVALGANTALALIFVFFFPSLTFSLATQIGKSKFLLGLY